MAKVCNNCGTNYDDNMMNCPNCGAPAPQMNQQYQQPMNNQQYNPQYQQPNGVNPELKSKLVAGLLALFLGSLGVHNFYLGNTGKAVAQLLITLLTCGFGAAISSIWALIEGIMILTGKINTDAQGRPLSN